MRFKVTVKPELSKKNKYWIDRNRYYELKYFCLQYPNWKRAYASIIDAIAKSAYDEPSKTNLISDPTSKNAINKVYFAECMQLVEKAIMATDESLYYYLLIGVTEGRSYSYLRTVMNIPCSRDNYYELYRRFFWELDKLKTI